MSRDGDDPQVRQASKDQDRFDGDTINPDAAQHSAEANRRMATADGRSGSGAMGDGDVTLDGYGPDADAVSKQDAESDVDDLAEQLVDGVDPDVARRYAREILRRGDVLSTASKADSDGNLPDVPDELLGGDGDPDAIVDNMVNDILSADSEADARRLAEAVVGIIGEVEALVDDVQDMVDDSGDEARMNDRMETA